MQRDLQECWHSAQRCLSWVFGTISSELKEQGIRSVMKELGGPPQCPALSKLDLSSNEIGVEAADRLGAVWGGEPIHLVL
jgi:hypothetical protein